MAGTLYIHILTDAVTVADVELFHAQAAVADGEEDARFAQISQAIARSPHIAIGQVSWFDAETSGDERGFIPATVQAVREAIGGGVAILDDALIAELVAAFHFPNVSRFAVNDIGEVATFLLAHRGRSVYAVTW